MYLAQNVSLSLMFALLGCSSPLQAKDICKQQALMHQSKDVATIQRLEDEWSLAYLQGNTDFERCLLAPDFTEILRTGEATFLADELELAAKNRGKNLAIPDLPKTKALLHGSVAVAYGMSRSTASDGKVREIRFADSYLWENGTWHVFFAQQTQVPNSQTTALSVGTP